MTIRRAGLRDMDVVLGMYENARAFMRAAGNPTQWRDGYPSRELLAGDMERGELYVCLDDRGCVAGVFCFRTGDEPTYARIEDGGWLNDEPYGVVHRLAAARGARGVAAACLAWCGERCANLRIDTHRDNRVMRHILEKAGFRYCGVIHVADGSPRLAYMR